MSQTDDVDWTVLSGVKASKRRKQALEELAEGPRSTSDIADSLGVSTHWARQQIKWLIEHDLAEGLTPEKHNYKLWGITDEGRQLIEYL